MSSFVFRGRSRPFSVLTLLVFASIAPLGVWAQETPSTASWTTFKGDNQRTGSSSATISLPLSLQWRHSTDAPSRSATTSPLVLGAPGRQRIYFSGGRDIFCLDAQTGAVAEGWKAAKVTSNVAAPLTLLSGANGDLLLVPQQNGRLTALRATDGGLAWETDTQGQLSNSGSLVVSTPGSTRIIAPSNAGLTGLTEAGAVDPEWNIRIVNAIVASPLALSTDNTKIIFLSSEGRLTGVDTRERKIVWTNQQPTRVGAAPVVVGNLVVTANARRVAAFETSGGAPRWIFDPKGDVRASPAVRALNGVPLVYFGTVKGDFYAVDANDGSQKWRTKLDTSFTGAPLALGNVILAGTKDGTLIGFEPSNGKVLWNYRLKTERSTSAGNGGRGGRGGAQVQPIQNEEGDTGGGTNTTPRTPATRIYAVSSAPSAVDGQVYVLGDNAALYAFSSMNLDADGPRVVEPSIALPNDKNAISAQLVSSDTPPLVPGKGPFYFAAQLDDIGSGINPDSIQVAMDGTPLVDKDWTYDPISGVLTATLLEANGKAFEDGLKQINIVVRDYAGNETAYSVSILIDNTVAAPSSRPERRLNRGGEDDPVDNGNNADGGVDDGGGLDNGGLNDGGGFGNGDN